MSLKPFGLLKVMIYKTVALWAFAAMSPLCAQTITDRVSQVVSAIDLKDAPLLISLLDDSCKIADLPRGMNEKLIPVLLEKYIGIADYQIISEEKHGSQTRVQLKVNYKDQKEGKPFFVFGPDKVEELGIIKPAAKEPDLPALMGNFPNRVSLPFKMKNGLIYLEAQLNGQKGYFMLDSGCPVVLLNRKYAPQTQGNPFRSFNGLNGAMSDVRLSKVTQLALGDLQFTNTVLASSPMEDDELAYLGLIGYEVLKDYVVTLDYPNQVLTMEKHPVLAKPLLQASFTQERHMPILTLQIAGKPYRLGLDCGANANVFYQNQAPEISALLEDVEIENVNGAEGGVQQSKTGYIPQAGIGTLVFKDMFTVLSENRMNIDAKHQLPIQGLLGTPFLHQYKTVINFPAKTIAFYNN